ncbi:hypothetical protein CHLNCDRAFT_142821 [Chlorella variabilis]|uniref:N-acetyltransferase domain-containing protein n=1 Tax=Chlorella variabilis TaxID=554065 RepID=E1Z8U2_CHLVA|nr:hypothetical protein CHLNCDRAFT_142821 [Chlorella variabilis]EFN57398.1 hypothetical protein CHLNCDRAFT_142821 [Chlorella variabilis]|eukprot:XP_005849500.1 hypothetical protein CHLNCDRAFT_142821 [Chlorella variabilis]
MQAGAAAVEEFYVEDQLPQGRLVIAPVQEADVGAASVLLTRAFAASAQGVHITDGRKYCRDSLSQPPHGTSRVVATTGLSFTRSTREDFPSLQPPDADAYMMNMAVDMSQRRQGHARRMLAAAEALVAACGFPSVYLHVRLSDEPAQQLYRTSGFVAVERDNVVLAKVRGITPRALLCKQL